MVSLNITSDIQYEGPSIKKDLDGKALTGQYAIWVTYNDKGKARPILYLRDKEGGVRKFEDLNDSGNKAKLMSLLVDYRNPAHIHQINTKVKADRKKVRGVMLQKGDSWNKYLFESKALQTGSQFAEESSFGFGEVHGGVEVSLSPVNKEGDNPFDVKPIVDFESDKDNEVYESVRNTIEAILNKLC